MSKYIDCFVKRCSYIRNCTLNLVETLKTSIFTTKHAKNTKLDFRIYIFQKLDIQKKNWARRQLNTLCSKRSIGNQPSRFEKGYFANFEPGGTFANKWLNMQFPSFCNYPSKLQSCGTTPTKRRPL